MTDKWWTLCSLVAMLAYLLSWMRGVPGNGFVLQAAVPGVALYLELVLYVYYRKRMDRVHRAWALSAVMATSVLLVGMFGLAYITLRDVSVFYGTPR